MSSLSECPVCKLEGGFHDHDVKDGKHAQHEVPRELLKEPGWAKQAHEELKREIREKEAEAEAEAWVALNAILGIDQEDDEQADQIAAIAVDGTEDGEVPETSLSQAS